MAGLWARDPGEITALIQEPLIPYARRRGCRSSSGSRTPCSALQIRRRSSFSRVGCLTIPAVGWVARRTFGPGAGGAGRRWRPSPSFTSPSLTSTHGRPVPVSLGVGDRDRGMVSRASKAGPGGTLLGLAVGLAQYLKYNGWLRRCHRCHHGTGGVPGFPAEQGRGPLARTFGWGLLAAIVALAAYWPWFQFVEAHGGYGVVPATSSQLCGGAGDLDSLLVSAARRKHGAVVDVEWRGLMEAWPLSRPGSPRDQGKPLAAIGNASSSGSSQARPRLGPLANLSSGGLAWPGVPGFSSTLVRPRDRWRCAGSPVDRMTPLYAILMRGSGFPSRGRLDHAGAECSREA